MNCEYMEVGGEKIALRHRRGKTPGLVWLGGYRSDMMGTKAVALDDWAGRMGLMCTRLDYSGHGESGGEFDAGTISRWLRQSLAVFDRKTAGPQILVGSSMGAWIALRLAQELNRRGENRRLAGMVLLAPAPDFTVELMEPKLTAGQRKALDEKGYLEEESEYSPEPNRYTRAFFEDGRANRVMVGPIDTQCPIHIVQGKSDPDVPYQHALKLMELLPLDDASISLVADGDHRLSRPQDIDLILGVVSEMVERSRAA